MLRCPNWLLVHWGGSRLWPLLTTILLPAAAEAALEAVAAVAAEAAEVVVAAGLVKGAEALATAKRKRSTGRKNHLAKQHVAPMGKRGHWGGINSTTEERKTRSPESLSPCGAAALNERRSDGPLLGGWR